MKERGHSPSSSKENESEPGQSHRLECYTPPYPDYVATNQTAYSLNLCEDDVDDEKDSLCSHRKTGDSTVVVKWQREAND